MERASTGDLAPLAYDDKVGAKWVTPVSLGFFQQKRLEGGNKRGHFDATLPHLRR